MLLLLDGCDGCGKDTQIKLLEEELDCKVFSYPTSRYQMLRDHLDNKLYVPPKSLFLLFLADIAHDQKNVQDALGKHEYVILNRYVVSTIAYQVEGISYEEGKNIVENVGYLKPDRVLYLDIDPKTSQQRKNNQKTLDRYESDIQYLEKVRSNYLKLYQDNFLSSGWHKIDASKSIEEINKEILSILR